MQVSKLTGPDLVHWFLRAAGKPLPYERNLNWSLVGPVMLRENISLTWYDLDRCWAAFDRYGDNEMQDTDALVAVGRCCVAAIFGQDIPEGKSQPMDIES